jgi:ketosteroid isomerase-like protein
VEKHPVEQLIEQADAAIMREDFDSLMQMYGEESILVVQPGMIATGKAQIRRAFEAIAVHFGHSLVLEEAGMKLLEAGDTVLVLAKTVVSAADSPAVERHATYVFRRQASGEWLCTIDNSYGHELLLDDE